MMIRIVCAVLFWIMAINSYAWNALGHKLVAQIAYDNLSPNAKMMCQKYLRTRAYNLSNSSFVESSTWMDRIRTKKIYWYDVMHYIDIPFSADGTSIPSIETTNALWAINNDVVVLKSENTNTDDKKLALRMLIHLVGDIHQPLHAITRVNSQLPNGDLGGNLFLLGKNSIGNNLHQYWDNGAGFLLGQYDIKKIKTIARQLERKMPCSQINTKTTPSKWARMSYKLAIKHVYQLNPNDIPSDKYQDNAQALVQKQIVYAGCRLASILNRIAQVKMDG